MVRGVTAGHMQALDRRATRDYGIPTLLLMEQAGTAIAQALHARVASPSSQIVCLAGRGHNGGDGLAAMRLMQAAGCQPVVFLLGARSALRDEPALYATILERVGVPLHELVTESVWQQLAQTLPQADWIVDALLGTGFSGAATPEVVRAIQLLNASGRPILAVDTPSGLHVDTGAVAPVAVQATVTVTFGWPKHGFFQGEGPRCVGELIVEPIGFPPALLAELPGS